MKKRDGGKLTKQEIQYFIEQVVSREVQDGQLGAMLMAMFIRNLDNEETTHLTRAMTQCGEQLSWPQEWKGRVLDKHSTGGVGDKVSLVLAPALAALGYKVPMVSGRGLGHTGGTLDKLEAIPGFTVSMSHAEMTRILEDVGCCIVGQTSNLVPADKILYATRDVTGTTENIGLITSSIISKKAAECLDALVLDVKVGRGSFMKNENDARELAKRMVKAGKGSGVRTVALLSEMDTPIGRMIGNALEVIESIQTMQGKGPADLVDLVAELGGNLLHAAGKVEDAHEGAIQVRGTLEDGSALDKFRLMMAAQGVKPEIADALCMKNSQLFDILPKSKYTTELQCKQAGYVHDIEAFNCAVVTAKMGAGRTKAGEAVNFAVGLELKVDIGDQVEEERTWVKIHHDTEVCPEEFIKMLEESLTISPEIPRNLIGGRRVLEIIR